MNIPFEGLTDRQKWAIELRARANERPDLARKPLNWITPKERYDVSALYKDKWALATGRIIESGWDIDCMPVADFGNATAVTTIRSGFNVFPLVNPAHPLGSLDPEPFELSTITAVNGDRQIGTSSQPIVILLGAYLVHITSAGAVFQPAATTINIRVVSAVTSTIGAFTTLATLVVNTAANAFDQIPITATTGRTVSITGTALTNIAAIFNGDALFAELVAGASIQGNVLYAMLELV